MLSLSDYFILFWLMTLKQALHKLLTFSFNNSRKDVTTVEDPFDAPTYNIPEKPMTFTEGASYSVVILVGLGIAAVTGYGVFKELIFEPKDFKHVSSIDPNYVIDQHLGINRKSGDKFWVSAGSNAGDLLIMAISDWQKVSRNKKASVFDRIRDDDRNNKHNEYMRSFNQQANKGNNHTTYASVVVPKVKSVVTKVSDEVTKVSDEVMQLKFGDFILDHKFSNKVVLGKLKEFSMLLVLKNMCKAQGFPGVDCKFVGGMWLMLEFPSQQTCYNFRSNEVVCGWFHQLLDWSRNFVPKERLVWLDIEGMPLRAWSKSKFSKVASKWGIIRHMDETLGLNLSIKEVIGWSPSFNESVSVNEEDDNRFEGPNLNFEEDDYISITSSKDIGNDGLKEQDSDPFQLRDLIMEDSRRNKMIKKKLVKNGGNSVLDLPQHHKVLSKQDKYDPVSNHKRGDVSKVMNFQTEESEHLSARIPSIKYESSPTHPSGWSEPGAFDERYVQHSRGGGGSCCSLRSNSVHQGSKQPLVVEGLDVLIQMGHAMGYSMQDCVQDKEEVINRSCVNQVFK
ncbi:unnamed protein product [Lactuca virosa]|uniref:DUF4283 domain-containing protein n=1 Tax=Lactuca virosa TaxID=75947 RepID=A0AAU9N028_9ASTR|nr:unnamed protein product [Lactuca virosa]